MVWRGDVLSTGGAKDGDGPGMDVILSGQDKRPDDSGSTPAGDAGRLQPAKQHKARFFRKALLSGTALFAAGGSAFAQGATEATGHAARFSSPEVVVFSLVIGAISAAMLSTLWFVRQKGNMETENREIRSALSDAKQRLSRFEALIADKNRRIVIWDGPGERPEVLGQLPAKTGAPEQEREFLAFGRWLKPDAALQFERALEALREKAHSFDLVVETQRGEVLETQGRVSGGRAFVRFVALNNLRAELAELSVERERLVASITTFQSLLDSVDFPAWQRDNDGRLVWVNHAYAEAVDATSPQQAIDESREVLSTVTREKIRSSTTIDSPFHGRVSTVVNGNRTFFDVVDVKVQGGTAGIAADVSGEEAAREELKRTLKAHSETLDQLATPVAIFDGDRRLQFYNQAFVQLWGLDIAFLESKPDHGDLLERLRAADKLPEQLGWKAWKEAALSVYQSLDTQSHLWYLPSGQTLRVIATTHPQGGATWVFENLTEQVNLETRYNTLVRVQGETIDHLAEGVAVFGPDGKIRLSNPAFRALWAITEAQAAPGTHIRAIEDACAQSYDGVDGWRRFSHMITSFEDERPSLQGTLELHSGLVLDYAVIPLPNAQTMLTFVNVTDSVRAERALTEKNEALRKADQLKNDFVQHVSYELRTPLTNIMGFTDLLKTPEIGGLNERQASYIDHISTSSSLLLTIVNDILDLATVDAGIMELHMADIDISQLLDEVSEHIAERLQESGVTLAVSAEPGIGTLVADRQRLKQIMLKLLANAANFAPDGSEIALHCWRDNGDLVFTVKDNGPGIPPEMIKAVFNRFQTSARTGKRSGAGLGLSIVESFVNLHHGSVSIDCPDGKGTTVTCRIPSGKRSEETLAAE
ncbi:ATP-binding protein [Rhizobium sp. PAMB 3182]